MVTLYVPVKYLQRDPGGLAQGFVDLDLGCSGLEIAL